MKRAQRIVIGSLVAAGLAGGGYAAGATFQDPEIQIRTRTATETETITEIKEVEVPGPVRWKTRFKTPSACVDAIEAAMRMADLIDEYDALVVDSYNTVDDAYNAGANSEGTGSTVNTLDQLEERTENLRDRWNDVPWYGQAERCK